MRNVADSFIMFLSNNLAGIPIHRIITSPDYPDQGLNKQNALNVSFLTNIFDRHINQLQVSLDVLHEDEYLAVSWLEQIQDLLSKRYFTPQQNWSSPSTPTNVDGNIYWDEDSVIFRKLPVTHYSHYNCTMFLKYYRSLS